MSVNYQNDTSFFMCLNIAGTGMNRSAINSWFSVVPAAKFRFINDPEVLDDNLNLKTVLDIYPGVKTIAIVSNPWARVKYMWDCLNDMKTANPMMQLAQDVPQTDFESFVRAIPSMTTNVAGTRWFAPITPQVDWVKYTDDNGVEHKVDYILKNENLEEGFQAIKDYFLSDMPLPATEATPDYRDFYTGETKQIVADIFARDIAEFGYVF